MIDPERGGGTRQASLEGRSAAHARQTVVDPDGLQISVQESAVRCGIGSAAFPDCHGVEMRSRGRDRGREPCGMDDRQLPRRPGPGMQGIHSGVEGEDIGERKRRY